MANVNFGTLLPAPGGGQTGFFLDCDYSRPFPVGAPVPSFPFLDQDDTTTVEFRQKYECALVSYTPPNLKAPMPGVPNAYPFGDVNFQDGQAGVTCFERTFGNIPAQRTVHGSSFRYSFQYLLQNGAQLSTNGDPTSSDFIASYTGPSYSIGALPRTVDSTLIYDYFLDGDQDDFPLLTAPTVQQIGNVIQPVGDSYLGTTPVFKLLNGMIVCADPLMLAEDDTYVDYKGAVKARKRRLITGYNASTFATNAANTSGGTGPGGTSTPGAPVKVGVAVNFTVSATTVLTGSVTLLTLTSLDTEHSWTTVVKPTFSASVGSVSNVVLTGPDTATLTYTAPMAPGQCVLLATAETGIPWGVAGLTVLQGPTFTVSPASMVANQTQAVTLTGTGTDWTRLSEFSASAGTLSQVVVTGPTTATATYAAPAVIGPVTLTGTADQSTGSLSVTLF